MIANRDCSNGLASTEGVLSMAARAFEIDDMDDDGLDPAYAERQVFAWEAMRFCGAAATVLADPRLLDVVLEAYRRLMVVDEIVGDSCNVIAHAVTAILKAGAPIDGRIRALARHEHARMRSAIARGVSPTTPGGPELLSALARDPSPDVRFVAKERLGSAGALLWWCSKFESDPIARLSPEEATRLEAPLRALGQVLDRRASEVYRSLPHLAQLVVQLPDELAIEAAELVIRGGDQYRRDYHALLLELLRRPRGAAAFLRLLAHWERNDSLAASGFALKGALEPLPQDRRLEIARELLDYVGGATDEERAHLFSVAKYAADVLVEIWPEHAPAAPLIAVFEKLRAGRESNDRDVSASALLDVLERAVPDRLLLLGRFLNAWLQGEPKALAEKARRFQDDFAELPKEILRPAVERACLSEDDRIASWGLEHLLGAAYDAERDGPRESLVRRLDEHPRLGPLLAESAMRFALPLYRARLRRRAIGFDEARATIDAVRSLWPERPSGDAASSDEDADEAEHEAREERLKVEDYLGSEELRGPLIEEEWSAWRAVRDAEVARDPNRLATAATPLPARSPRAPEDQALLDRLAEQARGADLRSVLALLEAFPYGSRAEDAAVCDELASCVAEHFRPMLALTAQQLRAKLGLAEPERASETVPVKGADGAWMDDDEER